MQIVKYKTQLKLIMKKPYLNLKFLTTTKITTTSIYKKLGKGNLYNDMSYERECKC